MMNKEQLEYLINQAPKLKIGVLGDFCLDVYWTLTPEKGETSIETGLTTTPVTQAVYSPGGAGNIVDNLRGIGIRDIPCFGTVGDDPFGCWLHRNLSCNNPAAAATLQKISRSDYHTPVYCKPLLNGHEQSRIDLGNTPLTESESAQTVKIIEQYLPQLDVLIINEQIQNGIHAEYLRRMLPSLLTPLAGTLPVVFDGRDFLDAYPGVMLKINAEAASRLAFGEPHHHPQESGEQILKRSGNELIVTDGANGCYVFEKSHTTHIPAIFSPPPLDTVGAGDSFTAGLACALAAKVPLTAAASFGNMCSAITIRKLHQTGAPSPEELRDMFNKQTK